MVEPSGTPCPIVIDNHYIRVIKSKEGDILGMIGFLIHPMIFNQNILQATEAFYYIHPLLRGEKLGRELLEHAEEELDVDLIALGDVTTSMDMDSL